MALFRRPVFALSHPYRLSCFEWIKFWGLGIDDQRSIPFRFLRGQGFFNPDYDQISYEGRRLSCSKTRGVREQEKLFVFATEVLAGVGYASDFRTSEPVSSSWFRAAYLDG